MIAQEPAEPRDAARLLDTRVMRDHHFRDLPSLLRPGDLLVMNDTRVRAARLHGTKIPTGGKVELLLLSDLGDGLWRALVRPARRLQTGSRIDFGGLEGEIMEGPEAGHVVVALQSFDGTVEEAVARLGVLAMPPYIERLPDDPERYQTVYSRRIGSAAAPTAGLHFTHELLDRLLRSGIAQAAIDLEVGTDTFRPLPDGYIEAHRMQSERYEIGEATASAIAETRIRGGRVIAVGTTVVRALETGASGHGRVAPTSGATDLFIRPGYRFRVIDGLITNFHVPGSTLVVLVAAILGDRWKSVYREAIARGYRFLSFGDAMYAETRR